MVADNADNADNTHRAAKLETTKPIAAAATMTDDIKRNKVRDIAAIASLLCGVGACLVYFGTLHRSPTVRIPLDKFDSSRYQLELEDLCGGENDVADHPTDLYDVDEAETDSSHHVLRSEQHERLRKGEPAEFYGPSSTFAVPVVVDSQSCHDGDLVTVVADGQSQSCDEGNRMTYSVTDLNSGETQYGIDETWVHRYERYQDGTQAMCVEKVKVRGTKPFMVPCLVKSSDVEKSNGVEHPVYYVVRIDGDTAELVFGYLPFQNVKRILHESVLGGSHVLSLLEDAMSLGEGIA